MESRSVGCFAPILVLLLASRLAAAEAGLGNDAVAFLKRSITAHSGGPAKLHLTYRGTGAFPDQSARPEGPFQNHPWDVLLAIDEGSRSIAFDMSVSIDGDFTFRTQYGFRGDKGFSTSYMGDFEDLAAYPAVANAFVPHLLLKNVLETATSATVSREGHYDSVTYRVGSGPPNVLLFDRKTNLLAAVRRPPQPTVFGDQTRETQYGAYRTVGGTTVPGKMTTSTTSPALGTTAVVRRLVKASASGPDASELSIPQGAVKRAARSQDLQVESLGRDVFLLRNAGSEGQFSYNVLAVLFEDHILVVEAPLNNATSRRVLDALETLAPGKPVRTLVQTHHHGDHVGGIRTYVANGTRIVVPAGTREYFQRIANAHSEVEPDALAKAPRAAQLEEVFDERTIRDRRNEVRLYDVPSGHSAHMLVVYLPEQRVLYQGDLISAGEIPTNATSQRFLQWLQEQELSVTSLAGAHGRTVVGAELETLRREGRIG